MWRVISSLAGLALAASLVLVSRPALADGVLYYRGYFSARATEIPLQGFVYQVDPNSVQPAFYYRYRTQQYPLTPLGGDTPTAEAGQPTAPLRPAVPPVLFSPAPLPGQYWFSEPGVYAFHTQDLGWPYDDRR